MERLEVVLGRLHKEGLKVKQAKCAFFQQEVCYLGHVFHASVVHPSHISVGSSNCEFLRSNLLYCSSHRRQREEQLISSAQHFYTRSSFLLPFLLYVASYEMTSGLTHGDIQSPLLTFNHPTSSHTLSSSL